MPFKSLDIFGSGPHRFHVQRAGQLVLPNLSIGFFDAGSVYLGLLEVEVHVTGRLVAPDHTALFALRGLIEDQLLDPPVPGLLEDELGRTWVDMSFVRFEAEPMDAGRVVSLAYEARFVRFDQYPQAAARKAPETKEQSSEQGD